MGANGSAGRRGDDVRSDVWVRVETRASGGVEIELRSKVEPYYGDAIRSQVRALLDALGLRDAVLEIEDSGALPFVIAARVEAAVRAAGHVPPSSAKAPALSRPPSPRDRLRRSRLYLPGNEPKFFVNAGLYDPDGVILDLEDSVHTEHKTGARLLVRNALGFVDFGRAERMVRINQLPLGLEDLQAIVPQAPDLILIPKVERAEQMHEVHVALDRLLGSDRRPLWLMPILESAEGIENAYAIATSSTRIVALTLGLEDYAADLGVPKSPEGTESLYARQRVVNAARAAGLQAIDSVYGQVDDLDGLRAWAAGSRALGFEGMGCLHPRQIRPIHEAYNPSPEQIARARRIVAAFELAQAEGRGVVSLGSKMIDPPVVEQALRVVRRAEALGLLTEDAS